MILTLTDDNGRSISFDTKWYRPMVVQNLEDILLTGKCRNKESVNNCKDTECEHYGNCIYKIKENTNG